MRSGAQRRRLVLAGMAGQNRRHEIFGPGLLRLLAVLIALAGTGRAAGWPETLTVKEATNFEIVRAGKVTGTVALAAGTTLAVSAAPEGEWVRVRLRNPRGRVRMAHTNLAQAAIPAASGIIGRGLVHAHSRGAGDVIGTGACAGDQDGALAGGQVGAAGAGGRAGRDPGAVGGVKFSCDLFLGELVSAVS